MRCHYSYEGVGAPVEYVEFLGGADEELTRSVDPIGVPRQPHTEELNGSLLPVSLLRLVVEEHCFTTTSTSVYNRYHQPWN